MKLRANVSSATLSAASPKIETRNGMRVGTHIIFMVLMIMTGAVFLAHYHHGDGPALLVNEKDHLNQVKEQILKRTEDSNYPANNSPVTKLRTEPAFVDDAVPTFSPTLSPKTANPTSTYLPTLLPVTARDSKRNKNIKRIPKKLPLKNSKARKAITNEDKKKKRYGPRLYGPNKVLDVEADWGCKGQLPWIEVLPTYNKILLKHDRRVTFRNFTLSPMSRSPGPRSNIPGLSRDLLLAQARLQEHIFHKNTSLADGSVPLDITIEEIYKTCKGPVYLGMATVKDDLYWQLIENFFYTAVRFGFSNCAMIICISDEKCLQQCNDAFFPCYNYQYYAEYHSDPLPLLPGEEWEPPELDDHELNISLKKKHKMLARTTIPTMEQIAQVKLLLVPKALRRGVSLFLLDLDVGFLHDPAHLVRPFLETPIVDIMVQEDFLFIMNRSMSGWKTWFTQPLPNIGLFLARGNAKTQLVFDIAWDKYRQIDDDYSKNQPGKDQSRVLDAMLITRGNAAMKYAYYDNNTAPLLDKLVLKHGTVMELGGELLAKFLEEKGTIAMHATCYEQSTKVHGLRASGAFWNPRHYDPLAKTLTKVLLYVNEQQLIEEVRSLIFLAMMTGRRLIVPNVIGHPNPPASQVFPDMRRVALVDDAHRLWPGFRVVYLKRTNGRNDLDVDIVEPGFYWRLQRDYDEPDAITPVYFHPTGHTVLNIKELLLQEPYASATRIVLAPDHVQGPQSTLIADQTSGLAPPVVNYRRQMSKALSSWANNSIGIYPMPYSATVQMYKTLPMLKPAREKGTRKEIHVVNDIMMGMRLCKNIFHPPAGNRTCFQICD